VGYPDDANLLNADDDVLPANCLSLPVMEDWRVIQHAPDVGIKRHPASYIGLRYDPRLLEQQKARPKVKSLHGCSGGAIWRTDGKRDLGLAGMVTQCMSPTARRTGERIIYGLRSNLMNDVMHSWIRQGVF